MKNNEENKLNEFWETPEITVLSINEETEYGVNGENFDLGYANS